MKKELEEKFEEALELSTARQKISMKTYVDSSVIKPLKANDKALSQLKKSLIQIENYLTETGKQLTEVTKSQQVHATTIIKAGLDFDKNVANSLR